ncbi:Coenzyme F420 hydrogenase/dehydrogenase, beta subunit C-terminal domain [Fusobacterium ulcerans]|uniref:4Fe-4S ferredoxin-type domain-containing protein n=1 Tax=Fusobacterium ulcerans 12-1B TaxID=457404 RepID=S2KYL6_9FUSO|nr:Coenzyme F420 hydrogenase/dehydrogenase, beta subunit C-terminal domain [Fusobacterium ulcerans]EPC09177.1 hypothetical protein HMPREF0402_04091 [Fusobacterium ulcerans 12-1B]
MKTAIEIIGYDNCTGCYGCYNKCNIKTAIEMKLDNEGFIKPFISKEKCIECGECQKACPVLKNENDNNVLGTYAAWSKNGEILLSSSSGGIFSEISFSLLKQEGIVYGAAWKEGKVIHKKIQKIEELKELRGSKYLQSNISNLYREVKKDIKNNKKVLFTGTPCQIAALKRIIKHENLFTMDFICHGIPSFKVFSKHCIETFNKKLKKVDFRNKISGWNKYSIVYYNENLKTILHNEDKFFWGFLKNIYLNKSCYDCRFRGSINGKGREGDITVADFWGVPSELFNKNGVSLITINNEKGKKMYKEIENNIFSIEVPLEIGIKNNPSFYKSPEKPKERELFFKEIDKKSFEELSEDYFKLKLKKENIIKRFIKKIFKWRKK